MLRAGALTLAPAHRLTARSVEELATNARAIAVGALIASVVGLGSGILLWADQRFAVPPVSFMSTQLPIAVQIPMALAYSLVGAVLATRQPRNAVGWIFLAIGLTSSVVPAIDFLVADATGSFVAPAASTVVLAWLASSFHLPMLAALVIVVFLIFPDGRPLPGRWWIAARLAVFGALLVGFGLALDPNGLRWYPTIPNPTAAPRSASPLVGVIQVAGLASILVSLGLATASMVVRVRRYSPAERRALVWIIASVMALALCGGALLVVRYGLEVGPRVSEAVLVATLVAAAFVPLAAALGMLRHHLFDVDLILNHALVYVPLTGFLGGLYAASVALFTRVFVAVTGDSSDVVIVLSTLVLAGTFSPLRKALENFVDRHFKPAAAEPAPEADPAARPRRRPTRAARQQQAAVDPVPELRELQARLARLEAQLARREGTD